MVLVAEGDGDEIIVYDKRTSNYDSGDERDYTARWINGDCWMTQNLRVQGALSAEDSNFTGTDLNMLFGNTTQESQVATAGLEAFGALVTRFYSGGSLYGEGLGIWNSAASVAPGSAGNFYSLVYNGDSGQFSSNLLSFRYNSYPIRCVKNKDVFEDVEWTEYGDIQFESDFDEPRAGEHIVFPDSNSIKLVGSTRGPVDLGVYYNHFDTDRAFSLQATIDPSKLVAHPSGFVVSISFSIVDEQGQALLPEAMKFMANYNSGRIIISDIEDKILTPSSGSFNLKLTHQNGVFEACVNATSEDSQCISDTKQIPTGAYLKVDFNMQHEAHTCSIIGQFEFQDVKMRLGDSIVTF